MKHYFHLLRSLLLAVMGLALAACSSSTDEPVKSETPTLTAQSVDEGAEVSHETTAITLTYSAPVAIADASGIQLNGQQATAKASGTKLTINTSLEAGKAYTLTISGSALSRYGEPTNLVAAFTLHFSTLSNAIDPSQVDKAPINASATDAARSVYSYLLGQYGQHTLSGVMANVNNNNEYSDLVYQAVGKHPALTCYDFIHLPFSPANWIDYSDTTSAETQWNAGGLVAYMWHWLVPSSEGETDPNKYGFAIKGSNSGNVETDFDIREALKEGTWQHKYILADIDKVAAVLKQLQNKGIAVLWRPLHEAAGHYTGDNNGAWFWWGRYGTAYTKQLWQLMYDRLVNYHGLNNLIWVWTVEVKDGYAQQAAEAYPGNDYVDIVGADIYEENTDSKLKAFQFVNAVTGGRKMVTLSECGNVPDPAKCYEAGDSWSWFMVWYGLDKSGKLVLSGNSTYMTDTYWKQLANSPRVVWREDMPKH